MPHSTILIYSSYRGCGCLRFVAMSDMQGATIDLHAINLLDDEASNKGMQAVRYLVSKLQEVQRNLNLQEVVQAQLHARNLISCSRRESSLSRMVKIKKKCF